jgi:hypothetical protein
MNSRPATCAVAGTACRSTATGSGAFERGVTALTQYKHREGHLTIPRAHVETITVDDQEHPVKLGIFLTNTKTRRNKLPPRKAQAARRPRTPLGHGVGLRRARARLAGAGPSVHIAAAGTLRCRRFPRGLRPAHTA